MQIVSILRSKFRDSSGYPYFYTHYAWVIVTIIAVMQMVGTSVRMSFGLFIEPLESEYGWTQNTISVAYAIASIVTAISAPVAGWVGDRYGAKATMSFGTIIFFVGMILTGTVTSPWQFYLYFGVFTGVAQAIFLVPLIPAAMIWFRRHLGLGMGIIMSSWGFGPALAAPLIGFLLEALNWRDAFWILGTSASIVMALLIVLFRDRPIDRGVLPYGHREGDPVLEKTRPRPEKMREYGTYMRKTAAFWNMSSIHFLGCVGHAVVLIYIVPFAVHQGLSLVMAAAILTVMSAVSVISRLFVPVLSENLGARTVMAVFYFLQAMPVLLLFWAHELWILYSFAILFGIGYGGETGVFPILNRKYFGHAPMGTAWGVQMMGAGLGMAFGGWIGGPIFDIFGTYDLVWWISIISSLGGMISIMLLESTKELIIPDWESNRAPPSEA